MQVPTRPRLLAAVLLGISALGVSATSAAAAPSSGPVAPVVLIGTGGVQWSDVSPQATPNLARLAQVGSIGDVTVRSVKPAACPVA